MRNVVVNRSLGAAMAVMIAVAGCSSSHVGGDATIDGDLPSPDAGRVDGGETDAAQLDAGQDAGVDLSGVVFEFCVERARLICDGNAACCADPTRHYSLDECSSLEEGCAMLASDPALRDGTLAWDGDEAEQVLDALRVALPACGAIEPFDYRQLLRGAMALGEDCTPETSDGPGSLGRFRCAVGLRCELAGTSTRFTGMCATRGHEGDTCVDFLGDCEDGLWCNIMAPTEDVPYGFCEPQIETGGACGWDHSCATIRCERDEFRCAVPAPAETWCRTLG